MRGRHKVLIGTTHGLLTFIRRIEGRRWLVRCECGTEKEVISSNVTSGSTVSCGCQRSALAVKSRGTHGQRDSDEYDIWSSMKQRCQNPHSDSYSRYGGRGIVVCEQWQNFSSFFADMGPKPYDFATLDRIDGSGNYCPENCRWTTWSEQIANRSNTVRLRHSGETRTANEWSTITGLSLNTIYRRRKAGWSDAAILTTPTQVRKVKT